MMTRKPKIVGTFCERVLVPKSTFDPRSFRYKKSGKAWLLIGCPVGQWNAKKAECNVGTRGHKLLAPLGKKTRCSTGAQRITKGA